jgi:hypothetical protein
MGVTKIIAETVEAAVQKGAPVARALIDEAETLLRPAVKSASAIAEQEAEIARFATPAFAKSTNRNTFKVQVNAVDQPSLTTREEKLIGTLTRMLEKREPALRYLSTPGLRSSYKSISPLPEIEGAPILTGLFKRPSGGFALFGDDSELQLIKNRATAMSIGLADDPVFRVFPFGGKLYENSITGNRLHIFHDGAIFRLTPKAASIEYSRAAPESAKLSYEKLADMVIGVRQKALDGTDYEGFKRLFRLSNVSEALGHVPARSNVVGIGSESIIFKQANEEVVSRLSYAPPKAAKWNIPDMIEPLETIKGKTWHIERLPFAQQKGLTELHLKELGDKLEKAGWSFWDYKLENIGTVNGKVVVIDRGAVEPISKK